MAIDTLTGLMSYKELIGILKRSKGFTSVQKEFIEQVININIITTVNKHIRENTFNSSSLAIIMSEAAEDKMDFEKMSEFPTVKEIEEVFNRIVQIIKENLVDEVVGEVKK